MIQRFLLLLPFSVLIFMSGCVEGPTVQQDTEVGIPDGRALVIIRHYSISEFTAGQQGMSIEEYEQYLISVFGETRDILVMRDNGFNMEPSVVAELTIPTLSLRNQGGGCDDTAGARLRVEPGNYGIFDNEVSDEGVSSFLVRSSDYLEDCQIISISHSF